MAASRLVGSAAACVMLQSFAAGHQNSYWSGCIKVAIANYPTKNAFKECFILFFALAPRSGFRTSVSGTVVPKGSCVKKLLWVKASACKSFCVNSSFSG